MSTLVVLIVLGVSLAGFVTGMVLFIRSLNAVSKTLDRMEQATRFVAVDLAAASTDLRLVAAERKHMGNTIQQMVRGDRRVAENLTDATKRADAAEGPAGAAADAAARSKPARKRTPSKPKA